MGLNVGFGIFGAIIRFDKTSIKRSAGQLEYLNFLKILLRSDQVDHVYLLSKSDYSRCDPLFVKQADPSNKIINIYDNMTITHGGLSDIKSQVEYSKMLYNKLENVDIDNAFFYISDGMPNVCIPGLIHKLKSDGIRKVQAQPLGYASQQVDFVNKWGGDWYLLANDPRYIGNTISKRDVMNMPKKILSQYNDTKEWVHVKDYSEVNEYVTDSVDLVYSKIENITLLDRDFIQPDNDRYRNLTIIANQSSYGKKVKNDYRYKEIKKYIIEPSIKTDIYGKWDDTIYDKHPNYFKGFIDFNTVDSIMSYTKYTFVIPVQKDWVTAKYIEMLFCGVIPFIHPDYDTQFNIIPKNSFLRVNSPTELKNKIELLNSDDSYRIDIFKKELKSILPNIDDIKSGQEILNQLSKYTSNNYGDVDIQSSQIKPLF